MGWQLKGLKWRKPQTTQTPKDIKPNSSLSSLWWLLLRLLLWCRLCQGCKKSNTLYKRNFFFSPRIIGSIKKAKMTIGNLYFVGDQSGLTPNNEYPHPGQYSPVALTIMYAKATDIIRVIFWLINFIFFTDAREEKSKKHRPDTIKCRYWNRDDLHLLWV